MAENITLGTVDSFANDSSAVAIVNNNSQLIENAFQDVLSRTGLAPNAMSAVLDMNNFNIINLPSPATINSPVRLVDVISPGVALTVPPVGTSGSTVPLLNGINTWSAQQTFTSSASIISAGSNTWSGTQSFTGSAITALNSGPNWSSFTGNYDYFRIALNNYPVGAEFGDGTTPIASAFTACIDVPSNSAGSNASIGISGYARTSSTSQGCVGTFGQGLANADGTSVWGGNFLSCNTPLPSPAANSGHTNVVLYGVEIDINLTGNGGSVNVPVRGLYMQTGGTGTTTNFMRAIDIDWVPSIPSTPWQTGINFTDGSCSLSAVNIGATNTGATAGSMSILFNGRNASVAKQASIQMDSGGDLSISSTSGVVSSNGFNVLTGGVATTIGTITSLNATAIPAGGTTGSGIKLSSTSNFGIFFGSGVPTLSAAQGSLYLRSDGAVNARLYINTDGGTTWTAFNTAS